MLWSCVSASTAAADNYGQLIAIRFILGIVEAPFFPGAYYILSAWYTRKELALRIATLYSALFLATAFSGLIAADVFAGLDNVRNLAGWQWLYIIGGSASFFAAGSSIFILPEFPESNSGSGKWLFSEEAKKLSVDCIARDRVSATLEDEGIKLGLKLAVMEYRT